MGALGWGALGLGAAGLSAYGYGKATEGGTINPFDSEEGKDIDRKGSLKRRREAYGLPDPAAAKIAGGADAAGDYAGFNKQVSGAANANDELAARNLAAQVGIGKDVSSALDGVIGPNRYGSAEIGMRHMRGRLDQMAKGNPELAHQLAAYDKKNQEAEEYRAKYAR
jgi:hypothetical protein